MSRQAVVLVLLVVVCGACGSGSDGDRDMLATRSSAPIAFLRSQLAETDPETGAEPSRQLVIVDPDGHDERAIPTPPGYDVESFSWSPDGRRIVLAARPPQDYRRVLFVANADGTGLRRLRKTPDHSPDPVWSPRGDLIAWDNHDDGWHAIWVMNVDGSEARRLTPGFRFSKPVWSPDGTRIAYEHLDEPGIYVMNVDGSGKRRLSFSSAGGWTREGIAYRSDRGIGFVSTDGKPGGVVIEVTPDWHVSVLSGDGRTVALSGPLKSEGGDFELVVATNQGVVRLTDNDREDFAPSLSPDGRSLAFVGRPPPPENDEEPIPPGDIYLINADGSGERNVTNSDQDESAPGWAPKP